MSYIVFDSYAPIRSEFTLNSAAMGKIIHGWPTKTVNGELVFGEILIASGESYRPVSEVRNSYGVSTNDLLKLFGTSNEKLSAEDWQGVAKGKFRFKAADIDTSVVTPFTIYRDIENRTTTENWDTEYSTFWQVVSYDAPISEEKRQSIRDDFDTGTNLKSYPKIEEDDEDTDANWHVVFADVDRLVFNRDVYIHSPYIQDIGNGRRAYTTVVEITYSRKDENLPVIDNISSLIDRVKDNDVYPLSFSEKLYRTDPNSLYVAEITDEYQELVDGEYVTKYEYKYHLKVSSIASLKKKAFSAFIRSVFDFTYEKKRLKAWQKLLIVVVTIIILIVAAIITVASAGGLTAFTSMGSVSLIAAIATSVSITFSILSAVYGALAGILAEHGYFADAEIVGRAAQTFSNIAKYAGYVALVAGAYTTIANGFTTPATEGLKEGAKDALGRTVRREGENLVVDMTAGQIANFAMSMLNSVAPAVEEYYANRDKEDIEGLQADVSDQEKYLEDYSSPKAMHAKQEYFESGAMYENSTTMNSYYYDHTQGLIDNSTTMYY